MAIANKYDFPIGSRLIFLILFLYCVLFSSLLQFIILPALPHLHAGEGLLKGGDWVAFHQMAAHLALQMQQQGWAVWQLQPEGNAPIGITAAIYFLSSVSKPWTVIPLNAAIFAMGGVLLYRIFSCCASQNLAKLAILPYALFPSALVIYGQIHKDVFSIVGFLAIVLTWVSYSQNHNPSWHDFIKRLSLIGLGSFFIWMARPYLLQPLLAVSLLLFILIITIRAKERPLLWWLGMLLSLATLTTANSLAYKSTAATSSASTSSAAIRSTTSSSTGILTPIKSFLDRKAVQINENRRAFAEGYPDAGSNIDSEVRFHSIEDILTYIPRALQIGLFAPFPPTWISDGASPGGTTMRLISGVEMVLSYLMLIGISFLFILDPKHRVEYLIGLSLALMLILVLALVVCNVGTLYRMRYGYVQLLTGLGMIGWGLWWQHMRERNAYEQS